MTRLAEARFYHDHLEPGHRVAGAAAIAQAELLEQMEAHLADIAISLRRLSGRELVDQAQVALFPVLEDVNE